VNYYYGKGTLPSTVPSRPRQERRLDGLDAQRSDWRLDRLLGLIRQHLRFDDSFGSLSRR
jgi:hypothetical protein